MNRIDLNSLFNILDLEKRNFLLHIIYRLEESNTLTLEIKRLYLNTLHYEGIIVNLENVDVENIQNRPEPLVVLVNELFEENP